MRVFIVDRGPNSGCVITINQEFLFRGTDYTNFQRRITDGKYCGSEDKKYGLSTFVAINIGGVIDYGECSLDSLPGRVAAIYDDDVVFRDSNGAYNHVGNRPILLAIAHEKYSLKSAEGEEGLIIPGLISLDDIVVIRTEKDLLKVLPPPYSLGAILVNNEGAEEIREIKRRAGIILS